uniref:UBX domain-containing protein 1 n=1 Tax=Kwoniella dejecticola CBS 10117 TaxID=1296121 RepID=A0A1A5ZTP7_9TREE|nr:uncharacterized protein I303_08529 [Kwoniella dejecticola CBS 10117]OBR81145.1 hypothetical protein I303_08529 [Kwoniella dejecticola CBS 10117]
MPGLKPTEQDIDQFVAITQASPEDAAHFLESGTTLEGAIEDFFATQTASEPLTQNHQDDEEADLALDSPTMSDEPSNNNSAPPTGGPRTLGGTASAEPLPAGWGKPERSRFGRLGENNDNDDDEPRGGGDDPEELYAGGGRSGLAVQNPDDPRGSGNSLVDKILRLANQNGPRAPPAGQERGAPKPPASFGGTGHTLGSDEAPSAEVPAAGSSSGPSGGAGGAAGVPQQGGQDDDDDDDDDSDENVQTRRLTFWRNGFSIEDGPLLSYDDPQNKALLEAIESGRAPPSVFGVRFNQRLNVEVAQRRREDYQPPPKKPAKPFGGSGNRLGSPAPEVTSSTSTMPGTLPQGILVGGSGSNTPTASASAGTGATGNAATFELDSSKPTTSIQLRLGDGTKMVAKVNLTHTVGDLRNYVSASRPDARSFVLQTTFPNRELNDSNETIETAKLQNAVVVQRFT